ncbi:homocysteine S-methyltransferase family protein [Svornostia abyssi]|uniref:Homocysteine S-methyltransferase family protein n=1 Tax=Svornostia abyssi TaxID=2898438 RepID=A0ABY5PLW7_9ACTN|nr:homocysteine S-methyltransferase family protein [Parviterribacteraceae bacterium J379]
MTPHTLPQLCGELFLTDGGIETSLIFHDGLDLPLFAAFDLLKSEQGRAALRRYYEPYMALARERGTGFVLESPTWRASPRWAAELGYTEAELDGLNRQAIALMEDLRGTAGETIVISGCIGPHDDGYDPSELLSADAAQAYHAVQVRTFADTAADMVTAVTMTYVDEALGIARAAADAGMPAAISFTVETDGRLPSGQPLGEAIEQVDAETGGTPAYYMINCAHPTHFEAVVRAGDGAWRERICGLRANASTKSHAELDEATGLDAGDPDDLGARYAALREHLPNLTVLGGCCGTDHRHVRAIAEAWTR